MNENFCASPFYRGEPEKVTLPWSRPVADSPSPPVWKADGPHLSEPEGDQSHVSHNSDLQILSKASVSP